MELLLLQFLVTKQGNSSFVPRDDDPSSDDGELRIDETTRVVATIIVLECGSSFSVSSFLHHQENWILKINTGRIDILSLISTAGNPFYFAFQWIVLRVFDRIPSLA
jgi:hypothetical protein